MNILIIARSTLYTAPGGDTVQILSTAKYLSTLGVNVEVKLTNELIDYKPFDLLHFFNVIRPADILSHIKASGKPYVVSPVFVDYSEFDSNHRNGAIKYLYKVLSTHKIEYLKTVARWLLSGEKLSSLNYLYLGQERSIKEILKNARLILPNSESENRRLTESFGIDVSYIVVPNAIDKDIFSSLPKEDAAREGVLCVARFEGLKNQHQLITALANSKHDLKLIGKASPNQKQYLDNCRSIANNQVEFIPHLNQTQLLSYYKNCKVHVLPSWFETTGLSSLEAAVMGCNIVITDKGDQREYFKDYAFYCDPSSPESILEQIEKAYAAPFNIELRNHILNNYTWEKTAAQTKHAYELALA